MPATDRVVNSVFAVFLIVLSMIAIPAAAQIPSWGVHTFRAPPDPRWSPITTEDVEAAYRLLLDNHPGAAPALHDIAFQQRLRSAYVLAHGRAQHVTSYEGYTATLAGFATAIGDKHIWSRPTFVMDEPRWTGIVLSKRGDTWVVTETDYANHARLGARLIGCDGKSVADLARKNLGGFRADWSVGAEQVQSAPWLLVDVGNPFIKRPESCIFEARGQRERVKLNWHRVHRELLLPQLKRAVGAGAAGFGLHRVGAGYWIALQSLDDPRADEVVRQVERQAGELRAVPFVVLDLRGNGGGSELVGRKIAAALYGEAFVQGRLGPLKMNCGGPDGAWRASAGNIHDLEYLLTHVVLAGGSEAGRILEATLRDSQAARARGGEFSGPISCPPEAPVVTSAVTPHSSMKGQVILLTDSLCFSSCLSVTNDFRLLGAFQVGQTTDAATHFTEVREQYLPSGYSLFSTLQSVDPAAPEADGPFEPAMVYNGDIADTAALERWIVNSVVPRLRRASEPGSPID